MIYHRIALNTPLSDGLLTYAHPAPLPLGTRVAVPFRNRTVAGIVWETDIAPDIAPAKILPVQTAFADEMPLPEHWRGLIGRLCFQTAFQWRNSQKPTRRRPS